MPLKSAAEMTFPGFYNPARIGTLFYPDLDLIAREAARADLPPAARDAVKIHLLIVDMQVDFCHESGALYIPGARDDIRRLIEFIYRQAGRLTGITCSLDSHLPQQIFHPSWWVDEKGNHPPAFTVVSRQDVEQARWRPVMEPEWSAYYVRKLQEEAKKELTIWPYHVLIGGVGNVLDPELWSAVLWHALARSSQPNWWRKGSIPKTEHYSIVQPEIPVPDIPEGGKEQSFLDLLRAQDRILVAGEAASHCVLETLEDLVDEFSAHPEMLNRIYVLQDCTSPVRHPQIDFAAITRKRFARFQEQGVRFINSTDALPF